VTGKSSPQQQQGQQATAAATLPSPPTEAPPTQGDNGDNNDAFLNELAHYPEEPPIAEANAPAVDYRKVLEVLAATNGIDMAALLQAATGPTTTVPHVSTANLPAHSAPTLAAEEDDLGSSEQDDHSPSQDCRSKLDCAKVCHFFDFMCPSINILRRFAI
jgi:hypothetical protein